MSGENSAQQCATVWQKFAVLIVCVVCEFNVAVMCLVKEVLASLVLLFLVYS